ncbi:MAG: hypothetical protein J0L62_10500 [Bacteroidetes bacterium]|nr:hypothetical protein [Bacteroidota bacterium]
MKNMTKFAYLSTFGILVLAGCSDFEDHKKDVNTGSADFSKYMAIGNSITAGYQSGALYEEAQRAGYTVLLAKSAGVSGFEIPTLSGEGTGGRLKWDGSFSPSGSPVLVAVPLATSSEIFERAINKGLARPYNNMGIPGSVLVIPGSAPLGYATDFFDVKINSTGTDAVVGPGGVGGSRNNGLFALTLRSPGSSLWLSMKGYQPKVVSFWLGNNDVLGYATSGGVSPSAPTDASVFQTKYQQIADSISGLASQPKVVVATIPDVTSIPFFTTVNVSLVGKIPSGKIYYSHSSGSVDSIYVDATTLASGKIYNRGMITLLGASAIGNGTSTFAGLAKAVPLGSQYVLDPAEIVIAKTAVAQFNGSIKGIAATKGWAVADVSAEFTAVAAGGANGKYYMGQKVTAAFITGGLFSYDGVHPSSLGQALIANYFVQAINAKYGAALKQVELNSPAGMKFGKISAQIPDGKLIDPFTLPVEPLKNMVRLMGGEIE